MSWLNCVGYGLIWWFWVNCVVVYDFFVYYTVGVFGLLLLVC